MLDREFISRKIDIILRDMKKLEPIAEYSFDEVAKDYFKMHTLEHLLELIIMRAVDINQHLITELGSGEEKIRGYEDTFHALVSLGVYDTDFAKKIAPSAGLRNRLVHDYNNTKPEIVYASVGRALEQYAKYCNAVVAFIERHE